MKRSTWIPLVAAGAAVAGVAAGVLAVLKKKKAAAAEESEIVVEGDEVVEIPMEETDGEPADAPEAPAE
jgi:flagellar basal body-associated protein FliL